MQMSDEIQEKLRKFDEFLTRFTRNPTDENIGLYEHWIDCRYDIEDILKKHNTNLNISCPCKPGDIIYVVDTDDLLYECKIVECILCCNDGSVVIKEDYHDSVICHVEHLLTDKLYLDCYRCFLQEDDAKKFIEQQEGERHDRDSKEIES